MATRRELPLWLFVACGWPVLILWFSEVQNYFGVRGWFWGAKPGLMFLSIYSALALVILRVFFPIASPRRRLAISALVLMAVLTASYTAFVFWLWPIWYLLSRR